MTYGVKHVVGIAKASEKKPVKVKGFFGTDKPVFGADWNETLNQVWTYAVGCHAAHALEFSVALICYFLMFDDAWMKRCKELSFDWVAPVVMFNLGCMMVFVGGWHWFTYISSYAKGIVGNKFNPDNQYERKDPSSVKMFTSSSGHLNREVFYTTLGWLQSAGWQIAYMWMWANGKLGVYTDFWSTPAYSLLVLGAVTYWREVHFYTCHRGMHPWWSIKNGLANGDVGAFLYRHVHSLHHKSYNPGPWSGLSMHPVEHLMYYSCATLPPLFLTVHPLHFLYCKFHADIAPIGGHDGFDDPAGNADSHFLHHAKYECNYGVPWPINFDVMFGTWKEFKDYPEMGTRSLKKKE